MATAIRYANGFRVQDVMTALMNRRRWRQPTRSDFPFTLTGNNIWDSGDIYSPVFEAIHKIVSPYNIWVTQEDNGIDETNFNTYLQEMQSDVILKVLSGVFNKAEHLERKIMFERFGRNDYLNQNTGAFVGVRIQPAKKFDVTCQIDNVALKFNQNVSFNLYLFHDTQPYVSLASFPVTAVANQQTKVNIGSMLSYVGEVNESGCYFLGYFQNDLGTAQAINEIVTQINSSNYFGMSPIEMPAVNNSTGVDVNNLAWTIKTHGFNMQMSAFRDYTQQIIQNAWLFDNLIGLQMAADVIEMIQTNTRTNKDQRITAEMSQKLYNDLNTAEATEMHPFSIGLKERIQKEAFRVKNEFYHKHKPLSITHDTDTETFFGMPPIIQEPFTY